MNNSFVLVFIALILLSGKLKSQTNIEQGRHIIEDAIENSAEVINESGQFEIPDELLDLIHHPLDLNNDNLEIFLRFNLLNHQQLNSLDEYKKRMGDLIEPEELQQIDGFDKKTILLILPYCTVLSGKDDPHSQQFTLRFQENKSKNDESFTGSNSKILFKYRAVFKSSFFISYTGEKDAGEEIFTRQKKSFDFNSFNIYYKGKGLVKKIIAGDYNIEYGQGLTAWTGLSFGGGSAITGVYKFGRGIVPYSGTDENRFLRGAAISIKKRKLQFDSWISYHAIDGNKVIDTLRNEEYITSLQTSGYHRTISENEDYHAQHESAFGTSINYSSGNLTTGFVISCQHFIIPIKNSGQPYTKYEFSGNDNFNAGFNYSYNYKNIFFFGENSFSKTNAIAFLNGIIISLDPQLAISFLWRYYPVNYINLKSNAYGINSENNNEQGNYLGINYKLFKSILYSGYLDIYSFPYLKYRVDQPSNGSDFFHQLEYTPVKKFTMTFRYRKKVKQLNDKSGLSQLNQLSDYSFNSFRLSARFKIDNVWEYSFRAEVSAESKNKTSMTSGTMVSQDLFFHPMGKPYSANCRYVVFNCPQFDTRIYEYENDVQGAFSIPFYYGNGSRFYTNINYKINRSLSITIRYAFSWIDDEKTTTNSSEIKLQLKAIFR